jgi:biopolymer transport protein ExbB
METPTATPYREEFSFSGFALLITLITTLFCNAAATADDYSAWTYCGSVVLNTTASGADISNNIIDFPVLVNLTGNNFPFDKAKGSGEDVRFAKTDGTHLAYQIERWDSIGAAAAIWVKVDTVYGNNSSQKILMYWGKSDASDSSNGEAVFDTSDAFRGVWHLKDGYDATYRNNDGTNNGVSIVDAAVGQGGDFENSETDNLDLGSSIAGSAETELTLSLWFKAESFSGLRSVFNGDGWSSGDLHYQFNGDQLQFTVNGFSDEKSITHCGHYLGKDLKRYQLVRQRYLCR